MGFREGVRQYQTRPRLSLTALVLCAMVWARSGEAGVDVWTSTGPQGGFTDALVVDPVTSTTVYAALNGGGVLKSTNAGADWQPARTGLSRTDVLALGLAPLAPTTLYAGTSDLGTGALIFKTTDGGATWRRLSLGRTISDVRAFVVDPSDSAQVYAGALGGVLKTTDGGVSWTTANTGLPDVNVLALAIDPSLSSTVYAGMSQGAAKSTDSGASWSAINDLTNIFVA